MFVLFGFGRETVDDWGVAVPVICPNCHNPTDLHLLEVKKWFSLFLIPVFPYEWNYSLTCDICSRGISLTEDQFERAKKLVKATRAYRNERISDEKYGRILEKSRLLPGPKRPRFANVRQEE